MRPRLLGFFVLSLIHSKRDATCGTDTGACITKIQLRKVILIMEKTMNNETGVKKLIPAVGFIKTRKLESVAMDMAERMNTEAIKKGYIILEIIVDRDGSRDIDREQLDEIFEIMQLEPLHDLFIRSMEDVVAGPEDQLAFVRYADDHKVNIHMIDLTSEPETKVWDGGIGC